MGERCGEAQAGLEDRLASLELLASEGLGLYAGFPSTECATTDRPQTATPTPTETTKSQDNDLWGGEAPRTHPRDSIPRLNLLESP
jgi:hypothetical protein